MKGPLFCDNPEEHGCGRRQAPGYPVPERGYRYSPSAVDKAAGRITRDADDLMGERWKGDGRDTAQAVLDIFIEAGVVVPMDLGYEAMIIDLRAEVGQLKEKVDRFAAFSRRDLAHAERAIRERDSALRQDGARSREFERGWRAHAEWYLP